MTLRKNLREIGNCLGVTVKSEVYPLSAAFDSRLCKEKSLFFALKGMRSDGHDFLSDVAAKGALAAVVSKSYQGPTHGLNLIHVEDVRAALQKLGAAFFEDLAPSTLAITGTVAKTTVKEFIATLLSEKFLIAKTQKSQNSQIGLPLMLINQEKTVQKLVLEMGMSLPGEISRLIEVAPPHFGVLTNVSFSHAENFENLEEIAQAKMELFSSKNMQKGLFNLDTMQLSPVQRSSVSKIFYSVKDPRADYFLKRDKEKVYLFEKGKKSSPFSLLFSATHLLENFLAAAAVARIEGLSWEEIAKGARHLKPFEHRFQSFIRGGIHFVDDSYNANVVSVKAALDNLPDGNKKIMVLGSVTELGKFSEACHQEIGEYALPRIDHLFCFGKDTYPIVELFKQEGKQVEMVHSVEEAKTRLFEVAKEGDVVLVKGSNSHKLWNVLY